MERQGKTNWAILGALRLVLAWILITGHVWTYFADFDPMTLWRGSWGGSAAVAGLLLAAGYLIVSSLGARLGRALRLLPIYPLYLTAIVFSFGAEQALAAQDRCGLGAGKLGLGQLVELSHILLGQTSETKPMVLNGSIWPPAAAESDREAGVGSNSQPGCAGLE